MQFESTARDRLLVVRIAEPRLDSALAVEFQTLIEKLTEEGFHEIVLDLSAVDFIDSTILGVMIQWLKRVRGKAGANGEDAGDLVLCGIGFKVRSLLQLTRMDRVFTVHNDEAEAVQAMTGAMP